MLLGLVCSVVVSGCAGYETTDASDAASAKEYLLPILQSGETYRLSDVGGPTPSWFYVGDSGKPLFAFAPPVVMESDFLDPTEGDSLNGAEEYPAPEFVSTFPPDSAGTNQGRRIRIFDGGQISVVDAGNGRSVVVQFSPRQYEITEIVESLAEISVADDGQPVTPGWAKFELKSHGTIHVFRNDEEVNTLSFSKPFPSPVSLTDRGIETSELSIGEEKVRTLEGTWGSTFLAWVESDGLEVWQVRGAGRPSSIGDVRPRLRRVSKDEWERAKETNPYPPPVTEPPHVAQVTRDVTRPVPASIEVASDFMADPRGETQPTRWEVSIANAKPVDAAIAATYRVTQRLYGLEIDGNETPGGDVMFEDVGIGLTGGILESESFYPEGRAALIRIIREEMAFAGVTSAFISSRVIENE